MILACLSPCSFDGHVVAKLPFEPFSLLQGISHRNLMGNDVTDCSFIFLYILCTMAIREVNILWLQFDETVCYVYQRGRSVASKLVRPLWVLIVCLLTEGKVCSCDLWNVLNHAIGLTGAITNSFLLAQFGLELTHISIIQNMTCKSMHMWFLFILETLPYIEKLSSTGSTRNTWFLL